jgi:hypothetical protein
LQRFTKHIALLFIILLGLIVPKETWHIFTSHTDTHCEFDSGNNLSTEHTHCEMLQFETSSFETTITPSYFIFSFIDFKLCSLTILEVTLQQMLSFSLRGPPEIEA